MNMDKKNMDKKPDWMLLIFVIFALGVTVNAVAQAFGL
jgi:hypothetical protein